MAGGLLQLVATGSKDAPLTYNPEITFFKAVYKKYTNFAIQQTNKNLGNKNFGTFNNYKIDRTGDLLQSMYFKIDIPYFDIIKTNQNLLSTSFFDINSLLIMYNNFNSYILYFNNNFYVIPEYIFKLYNININQTIISNDTIINNLLPEIINSYNIINKCYINDITENSINPIISLLSKFDNFFENYILNLITNSNDYEYKNQLITQKTFIKQVSNLINNNFYLYYSYYNNIRSNKIYYQFIEVYQYLNYININDINFIKQDNYDVDIVYNYCLQNNITNYLSYQTAALNYNSIFIYNMLLQNYPTIFNTFTFWKKFQLLQNNVANVNFNVNTFNTIGEWATNLNSAINDQLRISTLNLIKIYNRNYSIAENNINQLFNLMIIPNPTQLFIILSTFIYQFDNTQFNINFDDYNSLTNNNLLGVQIDKQLNNYNNLVISNALIYAIPNIAKELTIYPVDLMILYPYLAYKLVDFLANSLSFSNNMFLVYWRNKITNFYFLNYEQNNELNSANTYLYDLNSLQRNLTFYANFSTRNILLLSDIKRYFMELFYSSSFFACVDLTPNLFNQLLSTLNTISITQLTVQNNPISLNESIINTYNNLGIYNYYKITDFTLNNYTITISNWNNNSKVSSSYFININSIQYNVTSFTNNNFVLTISFDYLPPNFTNFILIELHQLKVPLITFTNATIPVNNFRTINIYSKVNNLVLNDGINATNIFNLNNLLIKASKDIDNYIYYFKIFSVTTNKTIKRYPINIQNANGNYQIVMNKDLFLDKNNITNVDIEFIYINYLDLGTKDASTIVNNQFSINNRNNWKYDSTKTYWLVYNNTYITLRYKNGNFIVNDTLLNVIYTIREIDNTSLPSFFNYINYFTNTNSPCDLMDFVFQTPMIFLALTGTNNNYIAPYLYFYNIPFLINNGNSHDKRLYNTEIFLNNYRVNIILPLNANQFFGKQVSTVFDEENLLILTTHYDLVNSVSQQFDNIYNDPLYVSIINTLEESINIIINLNQDFLVNKSTYYGKTSQQIIENFKNINNYDLINFNNEEFDHYNKLFIDIYGNNKSLISNSKIQGLKGNIYNYPATSYLSNRKISSNLVYYLENIPIYFNEQLKYIANNIDYEIITNKNEYEESYNSINNIINTIENNLYDNSQDFIIKLLYPLDDTNFSSIYYNNLYVDISNIINNNVLISNSFNKIINNDDQYTTQIINNIMNNFQNNKFNYLGPIFLNNNRINFLNIIDTSNYSFIKLDDQKIYSIQDLNNSNNIFYYNAALCNFIDTSNNTNYNFIDTVYYYKIQLDLSGIYIGDLGNCLYINNNMYYFNINNYFNNIIEIISINQIDIYNQNYFIGFIATNNINDLLKSNFNKVLSPGFIHFNSINIQEIYIFNYYNNDNIIINNFYINNIFNPIIKKINNYNFIYIDSSNHIVNLQSRYIKYHILPPFSYLNNTFYSVNPNENLFINNSKNSYLKLNNYILKASDLSNNLASGNYELSILPINSLNLIPYEISGNLIINNNQIIINFNNILNIPDNSFYLINDSYIYISKIQNQVIINDINIKYYNIGFFDKIILLDNIYFNNSYPLFFTYQNIILKQDLIGNLTNIIDNSGNILFNSNSIPVNNISQNNYVIDSIFNLNSNKIINYDISSIVINDYDEKIIELNLFNPITNVNFLRPVIIKNKVNNIIYPALIFSWSNTNNIICNNSFVILNYIPQPTNGFLTLSINYSPGITSITSLQPNISIFSNSNFKSNIISFNSIIGLNFNIIYKWKLLINNTFPVYFWTYFTENNFIYTNNSISEPIYINETNLNLFTLNNNVQLIGCLPNIIVSSNKILKINNLLFYNYINRKLFNEYYINSIFGHDTIYNIKDCNYHPSNKNVPYLYFLNKVKISSFTKSFINLDSNSINVLLGATYLIIHNNLYYYTKIISKLPHGIFVDTTNFTLDQNYPVNIYYSYSSIIFHKNNIVLLNNFENYQIIKYEFNDFNNNELILINNILFQVIGLNTYTGYYDLKLIYNNGNIINYNINGYYSLGVVNNKPTINLPILEYNEPIYYNLDSINLSLGDYYISNNTLKYKTNLSLEFDIFSYNKKGLFIKIFVINNNFYLVNEFDLIKNNEILVINDTIYKIKTIYNKKIYFFENLILLNGFYDFYYPFQPFNLSNIIIDICGNIIFSDILINNYDFIEFDNVFYTSANIPSKYFNMSLFTRVANVQKTKLFFENELLLYKYINDVNLDNTCMIHLYGKILDQYTINLLNNMIVNIYFYYNQPIKIGSTINFLKSLIYRDTTIIITLMNPINIISSKIDIYLSPLILNISKYYSIYSIDNFKAPQIDISYNIVQYTINNGIINVETNINDITIDNNFKTYWIDNYTQIDNNYNIIRSSLAIGSYHLILEISEQKDFFVHLIKIIYPNNIYFYTDIIDSSSDFYLDKIHKIQINFNDNSFIFDNNYYFVKSRLISKIDPINIWYKYPIVINGVPFYQNNNFYLEIIDAAKFVDQDIYIVENSSQIYSIISLNAKFYLVSSTYLGNNINFIYLKNINYIKSSNPLNKSFKLTLQNHNDLRLLNYITLNNIVNEKIVNRVKTSLDIIGDSYKYKIYSTNNNPYALVQNINYYIGDPFLLINQNYTYQSNTYIFTNDAIPNLINNQTQLFTLIDNTTEYFNHLELFKTVPEVISKINLSSQIKPYYILNNLKSWDSWSLLSAININNISQLLNKGTIKYNSVTNTVYQDSAQDMYFTNSEFKYLSKLLIWLNNNPNEINKINIQNNLLIGILTQLEFWIIDSTFWFDVIGRINRFISDLNINVIFNGYCLVFSDESIDDSTFFDLTDPSNIKRKYYLNNQFILNNNVITRNNNLIFNEISKIINNENNNSSYGIEINQLLNTLYIYGQEYNNLMNNIYNELNEDKNYNYFNSIKLFINNIWDNYSSNLKQLNTNFNKNLNINYNITINSNQIINYFDSLFNFNTKNIINLNNNEVYIKDFYLISNINNQQNIVYNLLSDPIYPYSILLSTDIIIPEVIFQINFYNLFYDSNLFNLRTYPLELDFYFENDLPTNINYSLIGLTNYNLDSIYLGELYYLENINNIDFNLVDYLNYKGIQLHIYKFDLNNLYVASTIEIYSNNILEIYKKVGLKQQINNYLIFYQNSFNYITNSTFINFNNNYYLLNIDSSGNYFINDDINFTNIVTIVILYNIISVQNINTFIYQLSLSSPFLNYNQYINNSINIIPVNFKLNNSIIPIEIIFYDINTIISQTSTQINITSLTHYANLGETPPLEVLSMTTDNLYLYKTYENFILLPNSLIWISDTSNYLLGEIGSIDNLNNNIFIEFLLNNLYNETELIQKKIFIETFWNITQYIFNPLNFNIVLDYPSSLDLNNSSSYFYYINDILLDNNQIYVNSNQLIINYNTTISGSFTFKQVYQSDSQIYKPLLNRVVNIKLINNVQVNENVYFIPLNNLGNPIGLYLYKIILLEPVEPFNIINIDLIADIKYKVNLLIWNSNTEIIISTNNILTQQKYKVAFENLNVDILSLDFFQNSYQNGKFYYQDNINSFNIFMNENINSFNFVNQPNFERYYMSSITTTIKLNNIFNNKSISRSQLMKTNIQTATINNKILEKPIFNIRKLFQSISLFLGDQMIETINEDTYNINYNYYVNDEKRKQINKVIKIKETSSGWRIYLPLIFWFYNKTNLALPLIALPYVDFHLKYQINNINKILTNNLSNSKFSLTPYLNIEICLDTILLDSPERLLFGSYRHEYIIERFVIYPESLIYRINQSVNMKFNNLVKDIFWISKPIYHANQTSYKKIKNDFDIKYNYYLILTKSFNEYNLKNIITEDNIGFINDYQILRNINQEILINNSDRLKIINNDSLLKQYNINFILFIIDKYLQNMDQSLQISKVKLYLIHLHKNNQNIIEYSPIKTLNIQSNGVDFMPALDNNYYNSLIPYQKFYNSPPIGYYCTSFSLYPCDNQPSGHLNFNSFDNVILNITSDNNVLNEPYNLSVVVKEYQVLRIMSGLGSLAWLN
jgi:hypothetical protein